MTQNQQTRQEIVVFGAGAFGQALAAAAVQSGQSVTILAPHESDLAGAHKNPALADCRYHAMDDLASSFGENWEQAPLILMVVPSQSLRSACSWLVEHARGQFPLRVVSAAKGIEQGTLLLPHAVMQQILPEGSQIATLSGPSFAKELVVGMMTSIVCASKNLAFASDAAELLHRPNFRVYVSEDIVGVEVGGALKNIIAMVAGAVDGLGLGHNARAAVITRGLGEIAQVGVALGADPLTFLGLSGLGDLVLTCTGELSRNRTLGYRLARGDSPQQVMKELGQVVEGYTTAKSARDLSKKLGLDTPIIDAVYSVLYEDLPVQDAIDRLVSRDQKAEFNWKTWKRPTP